MKKRKTKIRKAEEAVEAKLEKNGIKKRLLLSLIHI